MATGSVSLSSIKENCIILENEILELETEIRDQKDKLDENELTISKLRNDLSLALEQKVKLENELYLITAGT